MAKYTPGPWRSGRNHVSTGTVAIRQHTGDEIAYVHCARQGYGHKQNEAEALANARLMAGAPDLLLALENVLHIFEPGPLNAAAQYGPDFDLHAAEKDAVDEAQAAIKAARHD